MDGYLTDHRMVTLELHIANVTRGKSYWKLNGDLLINEEYVALIKHCIQETIAANDIDGISKHVLLQTVLCVVRGESIKFCSRKRKESKKRLKQLEEEINSYPKETMKDDNRRFSELKQERDELISGLMERNIPGA